jgi:hypothetical protein
VVNFGAAAVEAAGVRDDLLAVDGVAVNTRPSPRLAPAIGSKPALGFRLLYAAFATHVLVTKVVVDRLARPAGGERHVNVSRAVHDPLSCRLDLRSGEMPDLR